MQKVVLIGQALPKHPEPPKPFGRTSLYKWLESIDINQDLIDKHFVFSAVADFFPGSKNGSHIVPSKAQILEERPRLQKLLKEIDPSIIVPIGKLSIQECLQQEDIKLENVIGKSFTTNPYGLLEKEILIIPFPHPSGASTWIYKEGNKQLLDKALKLLADSIARF